MGTSVRDCTGLGRHSDQSSEGRKETDLVPHDRHPDGCTHRGGVTTSWDGHRLYSTSIPSSFRGEADPYPILCGGDQRESRTLPVHLWSTVHWGGPVDPRDVEDHID